MTSTNLHTLEELKAGWDRLLEVVNALLERHGEEWLAAGRRFVGVDRLVSAGWLPHPCIDIALFADMPEGEVAVAAEERFQAATGTIERELLQRLSGAGLSDDCTAPLEEAVALHRKGYFRASVRLVFPCVEHVVRAELLRKSWGMETQLRGLRDRLNQIALTDHWPEARIYALSLFTVLEQHLFERVDSAESVAHFRASGIPNRHACVHGVIDYKTFQHSLNGLIFADYLLRMISVVRGRAD